MVRSLLFYRKRAWNMAKIYTKVGDNGTTSLVGGTRVDKDNARVEAYGTVDELSAYVGVVLAGLRGPVATGEMLRLASQLQCIQNHLFVLQSLLAADDDKILSVLPPLPGDATLCLEQWIDEMSATVPPLTAFVIPGSTPLHATLHVARTVCRRAERRVVSLSRTASVPAVVLPYLNRLSDYLFTLSRYMVPLEGGTELFWQKER